MTEHFAADWLGLREVADHASRDPNLTARLAEWWGAEAASRVVDLGAGAGSNCRYLAPRLGGSQTWQLVDHDPQLLAVARERTATLATEQGIPVSTRRADLNTELADCMAGAHLITASALLDLVSARWLETLAVQCQRQGCAVLITISYNGQFSIDPPLADDQWIREQVNAHQRGEKTLGRALGPDALDCAAPLFKAVGFQVWRAPSDWQLSPRDAPLQAALIEGWAEAARQQAPDEADRVDAWLQLRRRQGPARRLRVGHEDFLALPCPD